MMCICKKRLKGQNVWLLIQGKVTRSPSHLAPQQVFIVSKRHPVVTEVLQQVHVDLFNFLNHQPTKQTEKQKSCV